MDKVYCEPNRYNAFADIEKENEYFNFIGRIWNDSLPKPSIHFYNETTGTDPIFEDGKFTGFYWFGMHRIGPFRVLLGYQDITVWGVVEKEGFNASTKDRVIYYGLVFIILTSLLCFFLYSTKRKHNRA